MEQAYIGQPIVILPGENLQRISHEADGPITDCFDYGKNSPCWKKALASSLEIVSVTSGLHFLPISISLNGALYEFPEVKVGHNILAKTFANIHDELLPHWINMTDTSDHDCAAVLYSC